MTFQLVSRGAVISAMAVAVSFSGAGVAHATPDNVDTHATDNGHTSKTARNNTNGLDWGDDWSLGGFPPINLSSLQPPNVNLSVPLSLGLPGLSLPSLSFKLP